MRFFFFNGGHIYFRGDTRIKVGSSFIYSIVNIVLFIWVYLQGIKLSGIFYCFVFF